MNWRSTVGSIMPESRPNRCSGLDFRLQEGWQNGYCTSLENWRPQGLGGSNPSPSVGSTASSDWCRERFGRFLEGVFEHTTMASLAGRPAGSAAIIRVFGDLSGHEHDQFMAGAVYLGRQHE